MKQPVTDRDVLVVVLVSFIFVAYLMFIGII
jgi:hypothetical protein